MGISLTVAVGLVVRASCFLLAEGSSEFATQIVVDVVADNDSAMVQSVSLLRAVEVASNVGEAVEALKMKNHCEEKCSSRYLRMLVAVVAVDDEAEESNSVDMAVNNKFSLLVRIRSRIYLSVLSTRASSMEHRVRECRSYCGLMSPRPSSGLDREPAACSRTSGPSADLLDRLAATLRERQRSNENCFQSKHLHKN